MILCDLPYGTTQCAWDVIIPFDNLWKQYNRIIKDNGAIVLTVTEPFSSFLRLSNLEQYKYDWIWDKVKGTGFYNAKKQPTYSPQKTKGHFLKSSFRSKSLQSDVYGKNNKDSYYCSSERYPRSIQIFSTDTQKSSIHSTQKPVALFEYLIKTYTNEGDLVLDNCMGSGTTAIACINTKRNFLGFESDTEYGYFEKAVERVENRKNEISLFDNLTI